MKDIAYSNTQFKRFAKYFNGFVEKKLKYYIGFATETSEDVWWYDGSKVMFRSELSSKFLHAMQENQDITIEELSKGKRLRVYTLPFIVKVLTFAP